MLLLTCALIMTRVACRSRYLYDIDSVNFALGMQRFDPSVHQPHPPGYFLYICLGRLIEPIFHDANTALVAISIAASCGALIFLYLLTKDWFGLSASLFAGLLFVFSPLVWFHGTVALTYALEAFLASMSGYFCWRVYSGDESALVPTAVLVAISAGFRPSFTFFLIPLLVFSASRVSKPMKVRAVGAFVLALLAWVLPLFWISGGPAAYWNSLVSLWLTVPGKLTVFNSSFVNSVARFCAIIGIYLLCCGAAAVLPFIPSGSGIPIKPSIRRFCLVWWTPGLLFFTFIFFKFVNSGYLLVLSPPVFALLGLRASNWWSQGGRSATKIATVVACITANSLIYFFAPFYCSFSAIRRFERDLGSILQAIPTLVSPKEVLIVGFDSHFLGYRHAAYYLPTYLTLQYPEVRLRSGIRIFGVKDRDTRLLNQLPLAQYDRFILLPLPDDDPEYSSFMSKVKGRFPLGELQTKVIGGREFTTGPVARLSLLFPLTARQVSYTVNTVSAPVASR